MAHQRIGRWGVRPLSLRLRTSNGIGCRVTMPVMCTCPLWTLDELRDAVQVLNLPIADHELDDRFDRCGGIPRPCLAQENEVVDRAMADCERAIASVTGPNQLVQVLCEAEEDDDRDACRYLLVHDEPSDDDPSWSVRRFASAYVSRRLLVKMAHSTDEQRGVLRGLVDQNTRLEWFRGWLTELEQRATMRGESSRHECRACENMDGKCAWLHSACCRGKWVYWSLIGGKSIVE